MVYHNTYYLSKLVQTLFEGYNHILLKEAVPYSVVKDYLKIERSPEAESLISKVFSNLKSLPNATQLDKRGYRISIPYGESSVEQEIDSVLSKYDFKVKDFEKGIATDTKSNREIKLGKALNIVSKKEPKAKELMDLFASAKSKGVQSQDEGLILVFSNHPYDIAGMSTGRSWRSCMNLITGSNKRYVSLDIEKGTIICYLAKSTDKDLKNPLGRILIKPFLNVEDSKDVILYPEDKTYGSIDNPEKFISTIDDIMEKVQNVSGAYNKMGCLYSDSARYTVIGKEEIKKLTQKAIERERPIQDNIFKKLPKDLKSQYINAVVDKGINVDGYQFDSIPENKKQSYLEKLIDKGERLSYKQYQFLPDLLKNKSIQKAIQFKLELTLGQYTDAPDDLKKLYIKNITKTDANKFPPILYHKSPEHIKKYFIDTILKLNPPLQLRDSLYDITSPDLQKYYIVKAIKNNVNLSDIQFDDSSEDIKKIESNRRIEREDIVDNYTYFYASDEYKKIYIDKQDYITSTQYEKSSDDVKKYFIQKIVNEGLPLYARYYEESPDNLKQLYIEKRVEAGNSLSNQQYRNTPNNLKQYYFELLKKNNISISNLYDYNDEYQNWLEKNK